ncbi:MAG: MarR family transcriptional regulator [Marinilabiliales bacterium]|nr:MAG: MarR family transcriptional regulator [Marinilabiliales bacterium]
MFFYTFVTKGNILRYYAMMERNYIFGMIFYLAQKWQVMGDKVLEEKVGITMKQWLLLVILEQFDDHLPTLSEAANKFGTSRQNIKQLVKQLEKRGFAILAADPADKRAQRIALTGKHRKFFTSDEAVQWQEDFISGLFEGVDKEEIDAGYNLINKLSKNI